MKIQIVNDVHLEFHENNRPFQLKGGDTLFIAGDLLVADFCRKGRTDKRARKEVKPFHKFIHEECAKYNQVYYIMGNHEHYHGIFDYTAETLREFLEGTNVRLLDKEWVKLAEGWSLFGGTLWTNYNNRDWFAMQAAKDLMNDHTIIKKLKSVANPYGEMMGRFLPADAADEFDATMKAFIDGIYDMERIDDKKIIMTHHAPCGQSVHPRFRGDQLNSSYFSELSGEMLDNETIKYWIHGHTHDTFDYMVGECRVLCNPRGYAGVKLNKDFNPEFEVEI
jgi:UDP-2,3-diacylglucosamine pyrophosphatase LpxH